MSAVTNFFKPRSEYLLDISTGDAEKTLKKKKGNLLAGKSIFKRVASGSLAAAFLGLSLSSGFLTTMSTAPKASADWIGGVVCGAAGLNDNSTYAYLGGNTGDMLDRQAGVKFTPDNGGITPVAQPAKDGKKTAYETYGAFSPSFTGWAGVYVDKDTSDVFKGTGGKAAGTDTSKQGSSEKVANANTVPCSHITLVTASVEPRLWLTLLTLCSWFLRPPLGFQLSFSGLHTLTRSAT
jgi:hypothetical protein